MTAFRQFGDEYGSHALKVAGGDNVQRDVLHVIGEAGVRRFAIHPTRLNVDYVGAHRVKYWDVLVDGQHFPTQFDTGVVR